MSETAKTDAKPAAKKATAKTCNVTGCKKKPTALGLCDGHYMSRRGDHTEKPVPDRRKPTKG